MAVEYETYELGKDVTQIAKTDTKLQTAVISVRLTKADVARLEAIGRENGKTISQVIRDAIAAYEVKHPSMIIGLWNGSTVTIGEPGEVSGNGWEVSYQTVELNPTGTTVPIQPYV